MTCGMGRDCWARVLWLAALGPIVGPNIQQVFFGLPLDLAVPAAGRVRACTAIPPPQTGIEK